MVHWRSAPQVLAAAVLLLLSSGLALAKPPDLPLREEETVDAPNAAPLPPSDHGVQPLPAPFYHLPVHARRTLTAALLFGAHPLLILAPIDELIDAPCDHPAPCPPQQPTCPYLLHEAARKQCPPRPGTMAPDVLTNLERLEEAKLSLAVAHSLHKCGQDQEAQQLLRVVHELAPGSRFDQEAQEMLAASTSPQGAPGAAEAAEPSESLSP